MRIVSAFAAVLLGLIAIATTCEATREQCYCELTGTMDDCCCSADTVDDINARIYPVLQRLVTTDYFKYYKVNLDRECRFWKRDGQCTSDKCHVETCSVDQVPEGISTDHLGRLVNCEEESAHVDYHSAINDTIPTAVHDEYLRRWREYDQTNGFCEVGDTEENGLMRYANLLDNPERYTGYSGEAAHKIWKSIYNENCFNTKPETTTAAHDLLGTTSDADTCIEKRVFYRAVSGLHASINMHVASIYPIKKSGFPAVRETKWGMNLTRFNNYFSPETTNGQGPYWLKNLYFTYLLYLRAISKSVLLFETAAFETGNTVSDALTRDLMNVLLSNIKTCPLTFDESVLFNGPAEEMAALKEEFRSRFRNITLIMDCVSCDKCRLWGKLQTQGLGTALKLMFASGGSELLVSQTLLRRNEVVALINGFARLSNSISNLGKFRAMLQAKEQQQQRSLK